MKRWHIVVLALAVGLTACSRKQVASAPARFEGEKATNGAMLAYEHSLDIDLDSGAIAPRIQAVRAACVGASFGPCNVLGLTESNRGGSLTVRIAPEGVARLTALASEGGKIASRRTRAEDIGRAVHDTQRDRDELEAYAKRLDELAARKDLSVSDLIALSREQAGVAEKRRAQEATSATQQNRLDTNLLTFAFRDRDYVGSGALGGLWENAVEQTKEGIGEAIPMLGFSLPFLILAFPLALLWWGLWRRVTARWKRVPERRRYERVE
jgi:hypothetical protein